MTATRDAYALARAFLAEADLRPDFAGRAFARIEAQDEELGESYLFASLAALVRELSRSAEDIASWSALIAARLEHDAAAGVSTGADAPRARALLTAATQRAGEADALLGELRRLVGGAS